LPLAFHCDAPASHVKQNTPLLDGPELPRRPQNGTIAATPGAIMPDLPRILRQTLLGLVVGLPLVIVIYAVVMGAAALLATLGDALGALALRWVGFSLTILFVSGAMLLVLLLGWERISRDHESP